MGTRSGPTASKVARICRPTISCLPASSSARRLSESAPFWFCFHTPFNLSQLPDEKRLPLILFIDLAEPPSFSSRRNDIRQINGEPKGSCQAPQCVLVLDLVPNYPGKNSVEIGEIAASPDGLYRRLYQCYGDIDQVGRALRVSQSRARDFPDFLSMNESSRLHH